MDKIKALRWRPRANQQSYLLEDLGQSAHGGNTSGSGGHPDDQVTKMKKKKFWEKDDQSDIDDDIKFYKSNPIAPISLISLFFFIGLSLLIVKSLSDTLPRPLTRDEIGKDPNNRMSKKNFDEILEKIKTKIHHKNNHILPISPLERLSVTLRFIEERARDDLIDLTNFGVRVTGSHEADTLATNVITSKLDQIIENNRHDVHNISYNVQRQSGAFHMKDSQEGHISTYSGFPNVIAKIWNAQKPENYEDEQTILVNCHTDTKPSAPGATDNMISCSVMLEILRVLSQNDKPLKNSVVFLFNGGEELGLQGAHMFVKGSDQIDQLGQGHKWSKNIQVFINLEGAGAGGREVLFQTGPKKSSLLVNAYKSGAKHPFASVIGEEAFQRGFIPSDTDFRIFRDFSDLPGLDMSFIKNGWVYHTKWDRVSEVPAGAIQNMGSNALGILEELIEKDLSEKTEGKMIFFDVLGVFFVSYSEVVGHVLNLFFGFASLAILLTFDVQGNRAKGWPGLIKDKVIESVILIFTTLLAWGFGIAVAVTIAKIFDWSGYKSPFQSYPTLPIVLFGVPAALGQAFIFALFFKRSFERSWVGPKLIFALISISMTFVTRLTFLFSGILLFHMIGWTITKLASRLNRRKAYNTFRVIPYLIIGELFPILYMLYNLILLLDIFIPTTARAGTEMRPNQYIALLSSAGLTLLVLSGLVPLMSTFKKRYLLIALGFSVFILNFSIVFGWIGKIPYYEKTPMRLNLVDTDVVWFNGTDTPSGRNRTGYLIWPVDPNTEAFLDELKKTVPLLSQNQELRFDDYNKCSSLYCEVAHLWPTSKRVKKAFWIPKDVGLSPSIKSKVNFTYTIDDEPLVKIVNFKFTGPTQMSVVLSPGQNYKLENWTIGDGTTPLESLKWQDRPSYFIFYQRGEGDSHLDLEFTAHFRQVSETIPPNSVLVDVKLDAFYLYGIEMMDEKFLELSSRFPCWTDLMNWSAYTSYYVIPS